jgi:hypothetical protein
VACPDKNSLYDHIRKSECSDKHYNKKRQQTPAPLNEDTITFGKYKDLTLGQMLRDRKYCLWLLEQDWFPKQYEYLYNRVKSHNPRNCFVIRPHYEISLGCSVEDFINNYEYFHLCPFEQLKINLTREEEICYKFYLQTIESLKEKIISNAEKGQNPFDIKAPSSWLKKFEESSLLSRDIFKEFLGAYDLPNVPYIVEDIKKVGGIDYKGAKSFLIAKEKSLAQEKFWENVLKSHYGEDIGSQYKFRNCFFDFIRIKTNTLYECKLGMKDFNEDQHNKYLATLGCFSMVYLIGQDCIVDLKDQTIYTTNPDCYAGYFLSVKEPNKFDEMVRNFLIIEIANIEEYFTNK